MRKLVAPLLAAALAFAPVAAADTVTGPSQTFTEPGQTFDVPTTTVTATPVTVTAPPVTTTVTQTTPVAPLTGYRGTCTATISPSTTSNAVGAAESTLSAGGVLCLNTGDYGNTTTALNRYNASGTAAAPIIVTSAPGATATIHGGNEVVGSYITLENLNIDESNTLAGGTGGANPMPPCVQSTKAEAIEFENGSHDTLIDNNIYATVAATREIGIYITASYITVQNNKISNFGSCDQTQHLIYDSAGTGTRIIANWMWGDPFGYAVQVYPNPAATVVQSNVFDGTLDGVIVDSDHGGDTVSHNVAINQVTENSDNRGGGSFLNCFHDKTGTQDTVSNNAAVSPTTFGCSSEKLVTITGSVVLTTSPFVNISLHDYTLTAAGAATLAAYGLWDGSGPPVPDPGAAL